MIGQHTEHTHIVGYGAYVLVWLGLLAFSGITVAIAGFDFGKWTVLFALTIAAIKTGLVLMVFMHLKFEDRLFRVFVFVAFLTLLIFFVLTFVDYVNM
jgi:cytochrome c oxidase subunit IV